ncbi:ribonuclease H-like protein [Apiospora sp. TS-2023a]
MEPVELSHGVGDADRAEIVDSYPYPPINIPTAGIITESLQYGANYYTVIAEQQNAPASLDCRQNIIQSLQLRCQTNEQLTRRNFILPTQTPLQRAQVKLPLGVLLSDYVTSPPPDPFRRRNTRAAIAIDCEMVGVRPDKNKTTGPNQLPSQQNHTNQPPNSTTTTSAKPRPKPPQLPYERSELAQLCAVDVITGEVLINELVVPAGNVVNWRTRYSGVNAAKIRDARARGTILRHWKDARALLLEYVDSETVLVGHSAENDLQMLRLAHGRIVDTSMQTAAGVFGVDRVTFPRIWGLKLLIERFTGKAIQTGGRMARPGHAVVGHDCVEDTLATRELALWCILHPGDLEAWGREMREEIAEKEAAAREKREQEEEKKRLKKEREERAAEAEAAAVAAAAAKARQEKAARAAQEEVAAVNKLFPPLQPRPAN